MDNVDALQITNAELGMEVEDAKAEMGTAIHQIKVWMYVRMDRQTYGWTVRLTDGQSVCQMDEYVQRFRNTEK